MEMNKEKLLEIIAKYLDGSATEAEKKAVDEWYESADGKTIGISSHLQEIRERSYQQILAETTIAAPILPFYKKAGFRAAAAIVLILGVALYFEYEFKTRSSVSSNKSAPALVRNDVTAPSVNKATLKLSDGSQIEIDSMANGKLAVQGNVTVIKKSNGIITYEGIGSQTAFNTLSVPRGSRPQRLELADGSFVWLNVASSVTYPVSFTDKERRVEITGEAYFEIAKDAARPFIVKKLNDATEIKVLHAFQCKCIR